ncbi:transposable element Tcb2 transposase [Trichonephila clavipes]|nr:transposable element Tcb2 transposase [Trichonephila clavipes]
MTNSVYATVDPEVHEQIFRLGGQSDVKPPVLSSQASLVLIYQPIATGSAGRRPGQSRRWATTPNEDRYLVLTARRDRNMNATLLQQHLRSATGTTVSTQTVRNRLHGVGLYARRPMVCVRLTSRHRHDFRDWATEHVNWRRNEWSNVLFSDESRFSVHPDNRRIFIWRDRGRRRVAGRQPPPQTLQELERALLEEWDRIPQLVINSHIDSMPQRCSTLLDVRGNHTPY